MNGSGALDVFLDERDAVDRVFEGGAVDGLEAPRRSGTASPPDPSPRLCLVMNGTPTLSAAATIASRPTARRWCAACGCRAASAAYCATLLISSSAATVVDDAAAMQFQPGEHRSRQLGGITVAASVRRCAHAVIKHTLRRYLVEVEPSLAQEPLFEGQIECGESGAQRLDPCVVFVNDVDLGHGGSSRVAGAPKSWSSPAPAPHAT